MSAKLHYYQATGRANVIRLALAAANIPFEDVYPSGGFPPSEEAKAGWRTLGGNSTTNVPLLEMADGTVYTQSQAVLRVVGRMGRLIPSDDHAYRTDKLLEDAEDLRRESYKCFVNWGASRRDAEDFVARVLPLHLGNLERQLGTAPFFLGEALTLADVACYDAVVNFGADREPAALAAFPALRAWRGRVEATPGIRKYLASDAYAGLGKFGPATLGK